MLKSKVRLYPEGGQCKAAIKFKVPKGQHEVISQAELAVLLMAYRDVVLKDYSNFAAIQHIKETVDLMEKEMDARNEDNEVEPEGGLEHIK